MAINPEFWRDRKVLLTGHTGFKGSWLACWLQALGAEVQGLSLPVQDENVLYRDLGLSFAKEYSCDLQDYRATQAAVLEADPEIILHLAAQPLVRLSYVDPVATFSTNVMGTAHLLEAVRPLGNLAAIVVATTDKVYENTETGTPFAETDRLGGHDPYSASKAATEIVAASFRKSFFSARGTPALATARAGNVIGGGDWSDDRIVPDIVRAARGEAPLVLRYPNAVRPWLHVLEPLAGYLQMAEHMATGRTPVIEALNFAPDPEQSRTVAELVAGFGVEVAGLEMAGQQPKEAGLLRLSPARAHEVLGWSTRLNFDETVAWTADWYAGQQAGTPALQLTGGQIEAYMKRLAPDLALRRQS